MRCIEIIHGNIGVTTATAININMRCIEILNDIKHADYEDKININMRCIEICSLASRRNRKE